MPPRVFVLGAGRAGRGLARALRSAGVDVNGVHGRREEQGEFAISAGPYPATFAAASVVLVTVRDAQLDGALTALAQSALAPSAIILHASGSTEPAALDVLRRRGHPCGTFHPLVPLAEPADAAERLRGAWIGVDGDPLAQAASRALAASLGARVLTIPHGEKARYHAAAVVASNFPTVLAAVAERLLLEAGVEPTAARGATLSLLSASVSNLLVGARDARALADVLTGPVVRGDVGTIARHLEALRGSDELLAAYRVLTRLAVEMAREGGATTSLDEIESLLDGRV
jgi:predicted short-subunit dehydrogenase-like oxidoreductase (DUF2520 family)